MHLVLGCEFSADIPLGGVFPCERTLLIYSCVFHYIGTKDVGETYTFCQGIRTQADQVGLCNSLCDHFSVWGLCVDKLILGLGNFDIWGAADASIFPR